MKVDERLFEDAIAASRKALEISPGHRGALSGLGNILKTEGQFDSAVLAYRESIRDNPNFGEAYWSLANLKTFRFEASEIAVDPHDRRVARDQVQIRRAVVLHGAKQSVELSQVCCPCWSSMEFGNRLR